MSWFARSIASSLRLDEDDGVDDGSTAKPESKPLENPLLQTDGAESTSSPHGVRDDLSDLTKSLTRQFWGVASFLAPPPQHQPQQDPETGESDPDVISGIRSDFAEIGGKFKSGISLLSNNIKVSEFTKMASDFLQLGSDDEEEADGRNGFDSERKGAVGVNEGVISFARDVAMHPDTWLDFPLPENADGDDDFNMSDAQQEHALAVERLAPGLAALRIELCPGYMTESHFWKIYFVLLHPQLDSYDAEFLSTPQILKAREILVQDSKIQTSTKLDMSEEKSTEPEIETSFPSKNPLPAPSSVLPENEIKDASSAQTESETPKHKTASAEIQIDEKPIIEQNVAAPSKDHMTQSGSLNVAEVKDEDDADDWLKEEHSEVFATSGVSVPIDNEDEVSFSDLEDDDGDEPEKKI